MTALLLTLWKTHLWPNGIFHFLLYSSSFTQESNTTIRVYFHFCRKINYHIANTYLPTMSLLAIVQVTLFFGKAKQEMAVTLSLTVLLVMYTFYQSISDTIPATAYLKLMDYWLIFCLLVPFILFLVQSYWYLNRQSPEVHTTDKAPHKSQLKSRKFSQRELVRMLIVGLTVIFILVYFMIAVFVYFNQSPEWL